MAPHNCSEMVVFFIVLGGNRDALAEGCLARIVLEKYRAEEDELTLDENVHTETGTSTCSLLTKSLGGNYMYYLGDFLSFVI